MQKKMWVSVALAFWLMSATIGCRQKATPPPETKSSSKPSGVQWEPKTLLGHDSSTVVFDIKPMDPATDSPARTVYDCSYQAEGKTARFRVEFEQPQRSTEPIPIAVGEGRFVAIPGSDNSVLLKDLKIALEAKKTPKSRARVTDLSFDAIVLGENQTRNPSGDFSSEPQGDWIAMKIVFPPGGDDGEVFMNLNPKAGKGEFSIKDSDYGDYLLRVLAKVL